MGKDLKKIGAKGHFWQRGTASVKVLRWDGHGRMNLGDSRHRKKNKMWLNHKAGEKSHRRGS